MDICLATVGTAGDVRPFVALGRRLADAGHTVTAVTWPVHTDAFASAGLPVTAGGPQAEQAQIASVAEAAAALGPMEQVALLRDFHLENGVEHVRDLRTLLAGHDLVVLHGIHVLAHAAVADLGVPWASATFDPVLLPTASAPPPGMPSLGPANRFAWWLLERALRRLDRPVDGVLERAGLTPRGLPLFRARSPLLHLVACSPSIIRVPPDLPDTTHVTGAWVEPSTSATMPEELESFLEAGDPPVVVTFGSMGRAFGSMVDDAVRRLLDAGRRVVVQGSTNTNSPDVHSIGPVDHRALFPRASVVVHHGGAGTTHTACAAGVPSVVVAHVGDQRYWADRLARLGVGAAPLDARSASGETLAGAVLEAVTSESMRDAAGRLARRLASEDGTAVAVRLIEATAGRNAAVRGS